MCKIICEDTFYSDELLEVKIMKQYPIEVVANWFLSKESMSPKKLQKITYYAEAWSNALFGCNLINDSKFQAWVHGPVSPELYRKYKSYGWSLIPKNNDSNIELDSETLNLLESVWVTYGDKSANELEALTHLEDPWKNARNNLNDDQPSNALISADDMRNYYKSIYIGD